MLELLEKDVDEQTSGLETGKGIAKILKLREGQGKKTIRFWCDAERSHVLEKTARY